ncbi:hypothetical protein AVEN_95360-1 [Araneus ventricosus]|uniref:Uncharacterized protein n=1 Tax=Araneus ventricosus TaxID=182803 RepID=A0A4Y2QNR5_ARAVE|nr:hypothetical protein AVEN_95360-1 [Araneus ventricosus]
MRTTPELTPHLQTSFYTTPAGGRLAATYDLKCNRPTTRQENQWNLVNLTSRHSSFSLQNETSSTLRFPDCPMGLHFLVFRSCEKASLSLPPMVAFQFYDPTPQMDTERIWVSKLLTTPRQFSSDILTDDRFWSDALQMAWNGVVVNAQLKSSLHYLTAPN